MPIRTRPKTRIPKLDPTLTATAPCLDPRRKRERERESGERSPPGLWTPDSKSLHQRERECLGLYSRVPGQPPR